MPKNPKKQEYCNNTIKNTDYLDESKMYKIEVPPSAKPGGFMPMVGLQQPRKMLKEPKQ